MLDLKPSTNRGNRSWYLTVPDPRYNLFKLRQDSIAGYFVDTTKGRSTSLWIQKERNKWRTCGYIKGRSKSRNALKGIVLYLRVSSFGVFPLSVAYGGVSGDLASQVLFSSSPQIVFSIIIIIIFYHQSLMLDPLRNPISTFYCKEDLKVNYFLKCHSSGYLYL